ncbi:MAG TPA: hypothetical protein VGY55_16350 [Pirellulales bacterium]|jgi:hypothetical protein|nr:hypothetical protein [Pirellulales bacterium]
MEAPSIRLAPRNSPLPDRISLRLANLFGAILIVALVIAALVLSARRVAGGLSEPLPPISLASTGLIAAIAAAGSRRLAGSPNRGMSAVVRWLPGGALVALAIAISLPGSSPTGLTILWLAIVAEETWSWQESTAIRAAVPPSARHDMPAAPNASQIRDLQLAQPSLPRLPPPVATSDVVQQLVRTRSAAGLDRMQGWLRTEFEPTERNATLHVAFCPPFAEAPRLTVLQISGPAARIKPVQLLPYGVRLEVKRLLAGHDPATVVLEFSAESAPAATPDESP